MATRNNTRAVHDRAHPYRRIRQRVWMLTDHKVEQIVTNVVHDDGTVTRLETWGEALSQRYKELLDAAESDSLGGLTVRYFCGQIEVAPDTGKIHGQCVVVFDNQQDFAVVKKFFSKLPGGGTIHLEAANGSTDQCIQYCTKEASRIPGEDSRWSWGGAWCVAEHAVFDRSYHTVAMEAVLYQEAEKAMTPALAVQELIRWNLFRILDEVDGDAPDGEGEGEAGDSGSYASDIEADVSLVGRVMRATGAAAAAAAAAASASVVDAVDDFVAGDLGLKPARRVLFSQLPDVSEDEELGVQQASPLKRSNATAGAAGAPGRSKSRREFADRD